MRITRALASIDRDESASEHTTAQPLNALAAAACYSPSHFRDLFRLHKGESIGRWLRRRQLDRAASAILKKSEPLLAIAHCANYQSNEAFTRAFSKRFGLLPSTIAKVGATAIPDKALGRVVKLGLAISNHFDETDRHLTTGEQHG